MLSPRSLRKLREIHLPVSWAATPPASICLLIGSFAAAVCTVRSSGGMQSGLTGDVPHQAVGTPGLVAFFFIMAAVVAFNVLLLHGSSAAAGRCGRTTIEALMARTRASSYSKYRRVVRSMSPRALTKRLRSRAMVPRNTAWSKYKVMNPPRLATCAAVDKPRHVQDTPGWREAASQWLAWDPNPNTRAVVAGWLKSGDEKTATKLLVGKRLAFGTSGLRGPMGAGYGRMNDLVIIQTSQGLCRYLEALGGQDFKARGIVIGHDHRAQAGVSSEGFANLAAAVFVSRGFRVFLLGGTVPTPLVSFGVSYLKACVGVMVTASHNPKKDNGYKVYWENGSQIIPPHDSGIALSITRTLQPWQAYDPAAVVRSPLCSDPVEVLAREYFCSMRQRLCRRPEENASSGLKVVYSAFHGVGDPWVKRAFQAFSLPAPLSVECQRKPNPDFPTLVYPNPEEQGTLKEAMILAEAQGASLVLANDPDADRLAAAERQPSGDWHIFSGNDIGILLGVWQWEEWRRAHPFEDPSQAVMIASTVSSKMLPAIAKSEGFRFEETLPGFKWMGHRAQELKAKGMTILFAFEEALGFGPGDVVFEKDGLSSAALFSEMEVALRKQDQLHEVAERGAGDTTTVALQREAPAEVSGSRSELSLLRRRLKALHERYGEFAEDNGYVRCEDSEVVAKIFRRLRGNGTYISSVRGYRVTAVRDLAEGHGYDSETADGKPTLPLVGGGAHFLTFKLGDEGVVASLRTSGTEPKIKYYVEMQGKPGVSYEEVSRRVAEVTDVIVNECLEPRRWGIERVALA